MVRTFQPGTRAMVAPGYQNTPRVPRRPQHTFQVSAQPFELCPIMIAPVLPGETLKSLLFQSRAVTDPILNPLIGWWKEYYFFYVTHRNLGIAEAETMMLDADVSLPNASGASTVFWRSADSSNVLGAAVYKAIEDYFRNEGEAVTIASGDRYPLAQINFEGVGNSAVLNDDLIASEDPSVDLDANTTITASEVDRALRMWQFQRANNLTDMDYEDFLATYGIRPEPEQHNRCELIRYNREWSYPTNTIDPSNGTPRSAVSWAVSGRADKDRFFREPGFIIGLTCTRPKVYLKNQDGAAAGFLKNAFSWLPAIMSDDPMTSLAKYSATEGPFATAVTDSDGYWVDLKDLYVYGDQMVNFTLSSATGKNLVSLPNATLDSRYPTVADIEGLFVNTANDQVREDGVVNLTIMGRTWDTTQLRPANV